MELKELCTALYEWAEKDDNNRSVLLIASEKSEETKEGYKLETSITTNGKMGQMTTALVDAMEQDKDLANLITKAFITYAAKHGTSAGIGVIAISKGKEAKDE